MLRFLFFLSTSAALCFGVVFLKKDQKVDPLVNAIIAITKTIEFRGDTTATILNLVDMKMFAGDKQKIDDMTLSLVVKLRELWISSKIRDCANNELMFQDKFRIQSFLNIALLSALSDIEKSENIADLYFKKQLNHQGFLIVAVINTYTNHTLQQDNLKSIFSILWHRNILNVNILVIDETEKVEVFTGVPFLTNKCDEIFVEKIDIFVNSSFIQGTEDFFKDKLKDLHECTLKLLYEPIAPFYYYDRKENSDSHQATSIREAKGFDVEIIQREIT